MLWAIEEESEVELEHGGTYFRVSLLEHARGTMANLARRSNLSIAPMNQIADAPAVKAYINHNRWKANCNSPHCGGCEFVWPDESLFMCCSCWNQDVGGAWKRVEMPENRAALERVLKARPFRPTRNWTPEQTVDDLKAENRAAGDPEEA